MSLKALATSPLSGITVLVVVIAFLLRFYTNFDTTEVISVNLKSLGSGFLFLCIVCSIRS